MGVLEISALIASLAFVAKAAVEHSQKRKVHSILHIQGRTEEAETFDFAVTLFADETPGERRQRILEICDLCEERRKYNNDRVQQAFKEQQEAMEALKNQT